MMIINVVGMEDTMMEEAWIGVSGLEKVDDTGGTSKWAHPYELSFEICPYDMPKHIFKSIPETEWEQSDYVRGTKICRSWTIQIESIVAGSLWH